MSDAIHADELALLRTVLEHPADDAPRLVYADRLDELAGRERCKGGKGGKQFASLR